MEYGLRLERPGPLPADPRELPGGADLPPGPLRALYFGTEFCEECLPGPDEAAAFCHRAAEAGLEACLLTPVVTDRGLDRVEALLADLERAGRRPEVVCNDWGVLSLVRERFPDHGLRAGRLFNRRLRDPRAAEPGPAPVSPQVRDGRLRALLAGWGVRGVETDADLEPGYLGDGSEGLRRALHLPYTFAASGRNCLVRAAGPGEAFARALGRPCARPCRSGPLPVRRDDTERPLWRAGNTLFYEPPAERVRAHLALADRVVLHERPLP